MAQGPTGMRGEDLFRHMVEAARDYAIFATDREGVVVVWNEGAERVFGYSEAEIVGENCRILFTPEDQAAGESERELAKAAADGRAEDERWHVRRDLSRFWASGVVNAIKDEAGRLRGFVKIARDETTRKLFEEERERLLASERAARADAEAANRIKDDFLATVSHELRTPLNAVLGWTRMLSAGGLDADLVARAHETIERNADAQARLIDDLLDVSRIISGKVRLEMRPVDPASFVQAAVEAHLPAAEAKGVRVETSVAAGAGYVHGDPERLQQVVWNLLSNAIKFTPTGGRVEVRVEWPDSRVEITVADTGKGINPEFLPHVFDRFRQADATTTRRHRGLGLGLAIVRHLVELHGGAVRAESGGADRGATFTVALPAQLLSEPAAPAAQAREPVERLDGVRVLVVDDELDAREMLRVALGQLGAEVETAASASEALEAFARRAPDVLVSDIGMPDVDGYGLVRRVRGLEGERGGRVPAIALTAYARSEDRGRAVAAGYDAHVAKPVSAAELADLIARITQTGSV